MVQVETYNFGQFLTDEWTLKAKIALKASMSFVPNLKPYECVDPTPASRFSLGIGLDGTGDRPIGLAAAEVGMEFSPSHG